MDDKDKVSGKDSDDREQNDSSEVTMVDVLQEEEDLEDDAEAVLGAGDDSSCTYDEGYMKRQPLYACLTCIPIEKEYSGGICLGCSYHCHEGHELVELYTKRNFRCDCGNSKYLENNSCKLIKDKLPENTENKYNHNFKGKYCTCCRPYPDPEDHVEDQMIQCIVCEDWYHGRHLEVEAVPPGDEFSEMICSLCVPKFSFLKYYFGLAVTVVKKDDHSENVEVTPESPIKTETEQTPDIPKKLKTDASESSQANGVVSDVEENSSKKDICKLKTLVEVPYLSGAVFFSDNWRKELCICPACKDLYELLSVSFLTDTEDTVTYYESQGREKRCTQRGVQRELDALSSLDRITRTEVVQEYTNLSLSLREYLKKFAENGKVVRDEDIREFFSKLAANKKQKREGLQYFCK